MPDWKSLGVGAPSQGIRKQKMLSSQASFKIFLSSLLKRAHSHLRHLLALAQLQTPTPKPHPRPSTTRNKKSLASEA
jgi:hypothetical protein